MSKHANPALIGSFSLAGVGLLFLGLVLFGSGHFFKNTETFLIYFPNSVNGLTVGAPVKFKGVEIGQVSEIKIRYDQAVDSDAIPVFIDINEDVIYKLTDAHDSGSGEKIIKEEIERGLRATLSMQSLVTGLLFIELDYKPDSHKAYVQIGKTYTEIPTVPSHLEALQDRLMETFADLSAIDFKKISEGIQRLLSEVLTGVEAIQFAELNDALLSSAQGVEAIVNHPDKEKIIQTASRALKNLNQFMAKLNDKADPLSSELTETLASLRDSLDSLKAMVDEDSTFRFYISQTLEDMSDASRALRVLAEYIERNPRALIMGRGTPEKATE